MIVGTFLAQLSLEHVRSFMNLHADATHGKFFEQ